MENSQELGWTSTTTTRCHSTLIPVCQTHKQWLKKCNYAANHEIQFLRSLKKEFSLGGINHLLIFTRFFVSEKVWFIASMAIMFSFTGCRVQWELPLFPTCAHTHKQARTPIYTNIQAHTHAGTPTLTRTYFRSESDNNFMFRLPISKQQFAKRLQPCVCIFSPNF